MSRFSEESQPVSRKRKLWWVLPLVVLIILVAVIYLLIHLSAADSEMYPTTMQRAHKTMVRLS